MIERLARHQGAVYALLAAYFIVNVVVRLLQPASLELDEGQQLFLAQWLAVGYDTQPPFYNWLQYGVVQWLGDTVLALSLLKNLLLFASYLLFGLIAHVIIRNRVLAVIATLGLITIPTIAYAAQRDLTHTVGLLFAACLFFYVFIRTLQNPSTLNYALTGLTVGIGILAKYNFILLPFVAAVAILPERQWRNRLFDPRILLTVAIAAAMVTPHAIWFLDHIDAATGRTLNKMTADADGRGMVQIGKGLLSLAVALAGATLPTLLVFYFAFGKSLRAAWIAESQWTRLLGRMFVASLVILALVVIVGGASALQDRWLIPLFFLVPIYLAAKLDLAGVDTAVASRRFGIVVLAIMVAIPLILGTRPFLGSLGLDGKQNVPYGPAVTAILASGADRPSIIVAGDQHLAGNIRLHDGGIPVALSGYEEFEAPYAFDESHPALAIWRNRRGRPDPDMPGDVRQWIDRAGGRVVEVQDLGLPYHYGRKGETYHFSYAWIYPAAPDEQPLPAE